MPRKKTEPTQASDAQTPADHSASPARPRAKRPAAAEDLSAPEHVDANASDSASAATPDQTPVDAPSPTPALSPAPAALVSSPDPSVKTPTERVFLIDAMSHVFRAFFAPLGNRAEPLTNSAGQVTQAVFIFTNMLRKLLDDERPHYIAAVFEGGKTFREESYADYKANRAEAPDDLKSQLPYIKRVCEAFSVPVLFTEGYEADDVIGTLAVQAAARGLQAVIVSNDKDMCQLVRDPAIICMRHNSQNVKRKEPVPPVEWCDEAWVTAKFEVPPSQIIDLLGLMGDSVDNIPGAPGIGAKGAVAIVKQFGSIEEALKRADEVKHKTYRESLQNNVEIIKQSKDLATIRTDAPITLDLEKLKLQEPDRPAAYQLFRELEFKALMREFADAATSPVGGGTGERRYTKITTRADLDALVRRLYDRDNWGFAPADTTPAGGGQQEGNRAGTPPSGVAISLAPNSAAYVDLANFDGGAEAAIDLLRDAFDNGLLSKCVHDLKRAVGLFDAIGVSIEGVADDTLLAAYLLDPVRSKYELADLAREAADFEFIDEAPDGWTPQEWQAAQAADAAAQTADVLRGRLAEQGLEQIYTELELPLAPLLHRMERAGLRVDRQVLDDLSAFLGSEIERLTKTIYEVAGREFKIGSPKQVGEVLEELNITKGRKTSGGQISTARAVLDDLAAQGFELPKLIIEYRELDKLKTVYADSLPAQIAEDGRIHGQLNQTTTATGRLSSSDPNLQNIPIRTELGRRIRRAFIPDEGNVLVTADYSQLELRLLAHVTRDEVMIDAFQKGDDVHSRTARLVFNAKTDAELKEKRRLAKIVNFAIAYAVEPFGLAARTGLSMKEAKQVIADYYATYKGIRRYMDEVPAKAREAGYMRSIYGRIRPLPTINDRNPQVRARAEREAINLPIQGCLPYETRILTSAGYRQIGELYASGSRGLQVWTGTRFAPFQVLDRGRCELAELDLDNGQTLRCDTRHQVLTIGEEGYVWKSYDELATGDKVCRSLPRAIEFAPARDAAAPRFGAAGSDALDLGAEFFYWLGYYFGDGWITHRSGGYSLAYSFGVASPADRALVKTQADECAAYFGGLGLRANFRRQSPQKGEVTIYSKGFVEFLADSGIDARARAATKRVPDLVFRAPLKQRKAFLRGMLDADGCQGGDGATTPSIHLCQRPLLADLQLLFRTVGVESKLRGPYAHRGFVSHRLDLIGGMTGNSLGYTDRRMIRVTNTHAPAFVVETFLREVSPSQLGRHSQRVIYSRLKHGGTTSVLTLAAMLAAAGAELSIPLYTWSRLRDKRALGVEETTYTLSVDDPLHRFDSEGVISKNTASDIVKSAMLRVDDALRASGSQARMVMQVHDELLVEAPRGEAEQVARIVKHEMEHAANLDVPLEVEVGIGDNWMDAK